MQRIMITGAGGQLGRCLIEAAQSTEGFRTFAYTRSQMDISQADEIREAIAEAQPDICFNCAAYTAVDKAESEADKAELINHTAVASLAANCEQNKVRLVHFSTDYVYADRYNRPLLEGDATQGMSVYARTKLKGELAVLQHQPNSIIIRTSWVYSEYGHNFVRTMLRLGRERKELKVVGDQIGSPTYARDLAKAAVQLAVTPNIQAGIYNFSNSGACSWYDFAKAVHELARIECKVYPINTEDYPTPAQRPKYSLLDKSKISKIIGPPRHWREALEECLNKL
ncbi:MAG: dTDP-4-dehydrorhamnose reductase [Bacteroidota bacterium]